MNRMYRGSTLIIGLAVFSFCLTNCKKDVPIGIDDMRQLVVPAEFNYETTTDISLTVKLPGTVDYSLRNKKVEIYNDSPENSGEIINAGAANNNGIYSTTFQIPVALDTLYIKSFAGWRILELSNGTKGMVDDYETNFDAEYFNEPPDTTPIGLPGNSPGVLWEQKLLKSGGNFVENGDFETNNFGSQAGWNSRMNINGIWNATNSLRNRISQQTDGDNKVLEITAQGNIYGGVAQLIEVEAGEEVTFTADIRKLSGVANVYLYLIPRNSAQSSLRYFSILYRNPAASWTSKTVTATMPANTVSCQILFWSQNNNGSRVQYDNAVVSIKGRVTDADQDGVEDDEDAYPNDADKAFNNYYPSETEFGTLAYEDMWPTEADYDFNDLVVGYRFNHIKSAQNQITSMTADFDVRAIGASISNGFGFVMDVPASKVSTVRNTETFSSDQLSIAANGTESGITEASIIVFADAFDVLPHPGGGLGINTDPDKEHVEAVRVTVEIDFTEGLTLQEIGNAPNNPFIFRTKDRTHEIHLPGYRPTSKADISKFGTGSDVTNFDNEYFYKTGKGLPWGMNLPVTFVYPRELVSIIKGHLKFNQWATSGGYSFMDWYDDVEGYRDNSKLYTR